MYILDSGNRRIRKVTPAGLITTFAGPGAFGDFWSQIAVDANHSGYTHGIYNNINVLNAEQQLYTAKRDLVKARYDTLLQALKLKAATGTLNLSRR